MKSHNKSFDWQSFINEHPLFGDLTKVDIKSLLDSVNSTHRTFRQDNIIFRAGEISNSFYLIGEGSVNVDLTSEDSSATNICTLHKGDYFGEMSAIDDQSGRAATISANEKCTLLEIKSRPFQQILKQNPELEFKLLSMLTARLRHVNEHLLKNTRLTYDNKFSLLSEKIESQSKVVDASLKASQSVFEQTKIRTDEIINSAERGRTRVTYMMSSLTALFTLLLGIFSFFGIEKLDTLTDIQKEFENKKEVIENTVKAIEKTTTDLNKTRKKLEVARNDVEGVNALLKKLEDQNIKFKVIMEENQKSILVSEKAKKILFETLISVFMARVEEYISLKAKPRESNAIVDPANLADNILEIDDQDVTIKLLNKVFVAIVESQLEKNRLNEDRISYFSLYLDQYNFINNEEEAGNPVAHFLSHYILLVTDTMPGEHFEEYSENFIIQGTELKAKYEIIAGNEIMKKIDEDFISVRGLEVYSNRIKAVNNVVFMR